MITCVTLIMHENKSQVKTEDSMYIKGEHVNYLS